MNVENIKKIITHLHLDGSLDIDLAIKWAQEDKYDLTDKEIITKLQVDKNCHNLNDYLEKFSLACNLLQTKERLEESTCTLLKKLHTENVIYAEIRFAPTKHQEKGLNLDEIITSVIKGMEKAKQETKIEAGIILCCMRDNSKEKNLEVVNYTKKYLNKGIVGIDLAGAENLYKTKDFKYIFDKAKELNIPYTIHAGEADGIESINQALDFGTKRLGHGIRCIEDNKTLERIIKENILLEICPTSNFQTEAVKGKHPLEFLYKNNINISINTDNDTVSNININEEYKNILKNTSLTINDLIKCNYNTINYLFTKKEIKEKLKKDITI